MVTGFTQTLAVAPAPSPTVGRLRPVELLVTGFTHSEIVAQVPANQQRHHYDERKFRLRDLRMAVTAAQTP